MQWRGRTRGRRLGPGRELLVVHDMREPGTCGELGKVRRMACTGRTEAVNLAVSACKSKLKYYYLGSAFPSSVPPFFFLPLPFLHLLAVYRIVIVDTPNRTMTPTRAAPLELPTTDIWNFLFDRADREFPDDHGTCLSRTPPLLR